MNHKELYFRLKELVPNAKFVMYQCDSKEDFEKNQLLCAGDAIKFHNFLIDWRKENVKFPEESEIMNIPDFDQVVVEEKDRKKGRNEVHKKNLALIGCYEIEKRSNPTLKFHDYLDDLEIRAKAL